MERNWVENRIANSWRRSVGDKTHDGSPVKKLLWFYNTAETEITISRPLSLRRFPNKCVLTNLIAPQLSIFRVLEDKGGLLEL